MADNLNFNVGMSMSMTNAAAVAGTTSTLTTTVTLTAILNGKWCTPLAAQTNAATPVLDWATQQPFIPMTPNQVCALVFGITQAGVVVMAQGKPIANGLGLTTTVGALINEPQFPGLPDNFVPFAYTIVRTAPAAAVWTPGAGSWTASGVSASTFQNVAVLPNRPQAS